jgi:TRAP-type uncharacterized transport system fused permease subunit
VPDFAAHMFIFYYAVLSEISPRTALALVYPTATADLVGFVLVAAVLAMQWWMPARKPGRAPVR